MQHLFYSLVIYNIEDCYYTNPDESNEIDMKRKLSPKTRSNANSVVKRTVASWVRFKFAKKVNYQGNKEGFT